MMVLSINSFYDHQLNAVHEFSSFVHIFGAQDQENSSLVIELES